MRSAFIVLIAACAVGQLQEKATTPGPTDAKAQKTYREAFDYLKQHRVDAALESFIKADKQDGGHCVDCQQKMIKYGIELR